MRVPTETWLQEGDVVNENKLAPPGYRIKSSPRNDHIGGGIAIGFKSNIEPKLVTAFEIESFECAEWIFPLVGSADKLRLVIIYRPTYSEVHPVPVSTFLCQFSEYLESVVLSPGYLVILGDFNIHVDDPKCSNGNRLKDMLSSCGLTQHIDEPTHKDGHTLDLVITRDSEPVLLGKPKVDFRISDHDAILLRLRNPKPPPVVRDITFRKLDKVDIESFISDFHNSDVCKDPPRVLDDLVSQFNSTLTSLVDSHAPKKTQSMVERPIQPWFNEEIKQGKQTRRKLERKYRDSKATENYKNYQNQKNHVNYLMDHAKTEHLSKLIQDNKGDQKADFTC